MLRWPTSLSLRDKEVKNFKFYSFFFGARQKGEKRFLF